MKLDKDNEFGMKIYTHISTIRILFSFGTIISFYLLSTKMLLLHKYQITKIAKGASQIGVSINTYETLQIKKGKDR